MKAHALVFAVFGGTLSFKAFANPTNSGENPLVAASAVVTPLPPPVGSMTTVRFTPAIDDVDLVSNLSNYSIRQVAPELGAGTPGGKLEDIDGDGDFDLVVATGSKIVAYKNEGTRKFPRYTGAAQELATVGYYRSNGSMSPAAWYVNFTFADVDGDGRRDLLCGEAEDGQISCFIRTNTSSAWPSYGLQKKVFVNWGSWKGQIQVSTETSSWWFDIGIPSVALEDLDQDGKPDLVVGDPYALWSQPQNLQVYRGTGQFEPDGSPVFAAPVTLRAGGNPIILEWTFIGATCPVFHDFDKDGDKDLLVSTTEDGIVLFEADGVNEDATSDNHGFPLYQAGQVVKDVDNSPLSLGVISSLQVADYSNDGDADLILVSKSSGALEQNRVRVLENLGGAEMRFKGGALPVGVGGLEAEMRTSFSSKVAFFDFDKDGKVDVLHAGDAYGLAIAYNMDTGGSHVPRFAAPVALALSPTTIGQLGEAVPEIVDFDGDGVLDLGLDGLLVGNLTGLIFLAYEGQGESGMPEFAEPVSILPSGFPTLHYIEPTVGDVNGDGKLDVVLVSGGMYSGESRNLMLLTNSAATQFTLNLPVSITVDGQANTTFMFPELVDYDGDGDLDLLVAERTASFNRRQIASGTIKRLRNDGAGGTNFVTHGLMEFPAGTPLTAGSDASPRVFDFNKDNRPDLLLASANSAVTTFLSSAESQAPGLNIDSASPSLKVTATLAASNTLSLDRKRMRIDFPMLASSENVIDLNDLRVNGDRAAIWGASLKRANDSDLDGLWDEWEYEYFGDLRQTGAGDSDGDGISNLQAYKDGLDPLIADVDNDTLTARDEIRLGLNLLSSDTDGDGLLDAWEVANNYNAASKDSDRDGIHDNVDALPLENAARADLDGANLPTALNEGILGRWDFEGGGPGGYTLVPSPEDSNAGSIDIANTTAGWDGRNDWPAPASGIPWQCLHLKGLGSYARVPTDRLDANTQSWSMWIKFDRANNGEPGGSSPGVLDGSTLRRTLFSITSKANDPGSTLDDPVIHCFFTGDVINTAQTTGGVQMAATPDDSIVLATNWPSGQNQPNEKILASWPVPASLDDGHWHHLVIGFGGGKYRAYFNGAVISTPNNDSALLSEQSSNPVTLTNLNYQTNSPRCLLGQVHTYQAPGVYEPLGASLDRLRVYNKFLTVGNNSQAKALYDQDIDRDGLFDRFETRTRFWRDHDGDRIKEKLETTFPVSPFDFDEVGSDHDGDGLSTHDEQTLGTNPWKADTDGDLMTDGWEVEHGFNPNGSNTSPNDGDSLTPGQEFLWGTDPNDSDTDNDGTSDSVEVGQGSHPNDPSDGGEPVPAGEKVTIQIEVGDESGSHSEDYVVQCRRIDPETGEEKHVYTARSGGFGGHIDQSFSMFRKGVTYTFQLDWQGTSNGTSSSGSSDGPDFDYTFKVTPQGQHGGILIDSAQPGDWSIDKGKVLTGDKVNDAVSDESDFKSKIEDRRIVLIAGDLDIDSDNNNGTDAPARNSAEDSTEDSEETGGKAIFVNNGDEDHDLIQGFADGFEISEAFPDSSLSSDRFVPLVIQPGLPSATAKFRLKYELSDPSYVFSDGPELWNLPESGGKIRIWSVQGDEPRLATAASEGQGGILFPNTEFSPSFFSESKSLVTAYVECIRPSGSPGDGRIVLECDYEGKGTWQEVDAVRVTGVEVEMFGRESGDEPFQRVSTLTRSDLRSSPEIYNPQADSLRGGGRMEHKIRIIDPRGEAPSDLTIGGESLELTGATEKWTNPFIVHDPSLSISSGWSGLTIWPAADAEGAAELDYNPQKPLKLKGKEFLIAEHDGFLEVAEEIRVATNAMKDSGWSPANPDDHGAFGKEVHDRVGAKLRVKNEWLVDIHVDPDTLEVLAGSRTGSAQVDLIKVEAGYSPQVGATLDRSKIKNLFDIKTSVSGSIDADQLEKLQKIVGPGKDVVVAKSRWRWSGGQFKLNPRFATGFRILGIVGAGMTCLAWVQHSNYDHKLAEIEEKLILAAKKYGDERNLLLSVIRVDIHNYLSTFIDPGVLALATHYEIINIMGGVYDE